MDMEFKKLHFEGPERRENVRIYLSASADFIFINDERSAELSKQRSGEIKNISATGVLLEIDELNETWKDGLFTGVIKIALEIKLPGLERPIRALARMVWLSKLWKEKESREKYVLGLNFVDITTQSQDLIKDYIIASYLKKP